MSGSGDSPNDTGYPRMVGDRAFWVNARLGLHRRIETRLAKNIDGGWFYRVGDLGIFARV